MGKLTIVKKRKKFAGPHLVHRSELTPMILPNSTAVECVGWEREREKRGLYATARSNLGTELE